MRVIFDPGTYIFKNVDFTKFFRQQQYNKSILYQKFREIAKKNGIIFDLVLSQKQLVFKANWSYISRACILPIDIAIRALCDLASSLEDSASMILVFATSKGVVRAPPMLPEMV